jgi:diguanylate cyclase (GGDEF)-like protein/putative nucleotidyltransferase with HDIG domain
MPNKAKVFIGVTASIGIVLAIMSIQHWQSASLSRFLLYLAIALCTSGMKVVLPGLNGTMSVNFLFVLMGVLELSPSETMLLGCGAMFVQCCWKMKKPPLPVRLLFNVFSSIAPAIWICEWVYHHSGNLLHHSMPLMVMAAASAYFLTNTYAVVGIMTLVEGRPFFRTWNQTFFWSFPCYLAGAAMVTFVHFASQSFGWGMWLIVTPIVYWIYRSYRIYLGRLADEKRHGEDVASLHLRTIEALALAIDAKDHTTYAHLQRVRVYATEIGREMGLSSAELEALKTASILHDIGKLAVPEHIISKPGRLTPEEFEKMKVHPVVGAEILERVKFPYPVVPIVRGHHEKWDGSGYPDGLAGESIPIGARILAAVDCLDALASERQYRRALPLKQAMEYIASLAGKEFDPKIVDLLKMRYTELEQLATMQSELLLPLPTEIKGENVAAPAAGFECEAQAQPTASEQDFLMSIASARHEAHMLFELMHDLGNSLSLEDTLSVVSGRLRKLVPYDAIVIWVRENAVVVPKYVNGDDFRLFSSLEIPIGQGLSGWVVGNAKSILNGNPSVESGYLAGTLKSSVLHSALSVPLDGLKGIVGALTLYRTEVDSFNKDHMRILLAVSSKLALSIENALTFQQAQSSATTDFLTDLPNARSLFLHLDREIALCKRTGANLAVMVCDLDHFKEINDRFGHLEGNRVLRVFAKALRDNFRPYDYVARMGGDEFVVVASGLTPEAAEPKTQMIKELATTVGRQVCGANILSASVGTTFFQTDGVDAEQLLAKADRRMYMIKRSHGDDFATGNPAMSKSKLNGSTEQVH